MIGVITFLYVACYLLLLVFAVCSLCMFVCIYVAHCSMLLMFVSCLLLNAACVCMYVCCLQLDIARVCICCSLFCAAHVCTADVGRVSVLLAYCLVLPTAQC